MSDFQQVVFHVPTAIRRGLNAGIYVQYGGVIRKTTGEIVKHLRPVIPGVGEAIGLGQKALQAAKKIPLAGLVAIGAGAVAMTAVAISYKIRWSKVQEIVEQFEASLNVYLKAVNKGKLKHEMLERLLSDLAEMRLVEKKKKFNWLFPQADYAQLLKILQGYTLELARRNNVTPPERNEHSEGEDLIAEIEEYLRFQDAIIQAKS
jgi:hypothetical protein